MHLYCVCLFLFDKEVLSGTLAESFKAAIISIFILNIYIITMDDYLYVRKGLLVVIITQFCRSISSFSSIFWLCSLQRYTVWCKSVSPLTLIVFGAQQATVFSWNALKTDRTLPAQHQTTNWLVARYFPSRVDRVQNRAKKESECSTCIHQVSRNVTPNECGVFTACFHCLQMAKKNVTGLNLNTV